IVLWDRGTDDTRPRRENVSDRLAFSNEAPWQVLRFDECKGALARTSGDEPLGALGFGRQLNARVVQFDYRDLKLCPVGETLRGKSRLELGDTCPQIFEFRVQRRLFTLDQRLAKRHDASGFDQEPAHESIGASAHVGAFWEPDHTLRGRIERGRDPKQ